MPSFIVCVWLSFMQKVPFPTTPLGKKMWALRRGKIGTDMTITTSTGTRHAHMVILVSYDARLKGLGFYVCGVSGLILKVFVVERKCRLVNVCLTSFLRGKCL